MKIKTINLPEHKQKHIRSLLDSDAFAMLKDVILSDAFRLESDIVDCALKQTTGYDAEAKGAAERAMQVHQTLALLEEISARKEFTISTAEPSSIITQPPTKK